MNNFLHSSKLIYGCMGLGGQWNHDPLDEQTCKQATIAIETALEKGIHFFDHADIYCYGKSEQAFSSLWQLHPSLREKIILQSKCGIRFPQESVPGRYDFSYQHITTSVEQSLKRLKTSYLDVLLLHRPDPLVQPEEVAKAFTDLRSSGKVRFFGVSNHTPLQIQLLDKYLDDKIHINQIQYSLLHTDLLDASIAGNCSVESSGCAGTIEYCRLNDIILQAWSPLAGGRIFQNDKVKNILDEMAQQKNCTTTALAIAWILYHPAKIQPVIGSTQKQRIAEAAASREIVMTREEWYSLYIAAREESLP